MFRFNLIFGMIIGPFLLFLGKKPVFFADKIFLVEKA